jgi:hypothetical protein
MVEDVAHKTMQTLRAHADFEDVADFQGALRL